MNSVLCIINCRLYKDEREAIDKAIREEFIIDLVDLLDDLIHSFMEVLINDTFINIHSFIMRI